MHINIINIHDHAYSYAHIILSINISQEFKHINHGDIFISKYHAKSINKKIFNKAQIHFTSLRNIIIKHSRSINQ